MIYTSPELDIRLTHKTRHRRRHIMTNDFKLNDFGIHDFKKLSLHKNMNELRLY